MSEPVSVCALAGSPRFFILLVISAFAKLTHNHRRNRAKS
jgi:hypothetical protein